MGWVRERLDELPPRSQMRYQLALGQLALCREEAQSARDVLDDMPEGWDEDLDLALDVWLARYHVEQALGRTAAARAAGEKAKVVAESRGFVLCLYEGQGTERACASAAPVLLEQVVGGRPPLF